MLEQIKAECFHCGLPVPVGSTYKVTIKKTERDMCCPGCQAVAEAIVAGGMEDYYEFRTEHAEQGQELVPDFLQQSMAYDLDAVQESFVRHSESDSGDVREADLILEGVSGALCGSRYDG